MWEDFVCRTPDGDPIFQILLIGTFVLHTSAKTLAPASKTMQHPPATSVVRCRFRVSKHIHCSNITTFTWEQEQNAPKPFSIPFLFIMVGYTNSTVRGLSTGLSTCNDSYPRIFMKPCSMALLFVRIIYSKTVGKNSRKPIFIRIIYGLPSKT